MPHILARLAAAAILGRSIRIHGAGSTRTSRYADPCFAIYRGAERFGVFVILAAFRPQSIGRVVVEDDALQRPGIIRIVGIFRGNFKLQGTAGGDLHPLEAHHLKPICIFCDLIAAEVALHHRRKQEFVLLVCGHHRSVLFVHSSFLLLIFLMDGSYLSSHLVNSAPLPCRHGENVVADAFQRGCPVIVLNILAVARYGVGQTI